MKKKVDFKSFINRPSLMAQLQSMGFTANSDEIAEEIMQEFDSKMKQIAKEVKNRNRIKANDATKKSQPAKEVLTNEEIERLPWWVRSQINESMLVGKSGDVVQVPDGRKFHRKNKLNDLPGGQWTYFLNSVVNTRFPTNGKEAFAHHIRKIHPSPKPPQLMREIIEFFTKENELVLDYFMGVGGSLLGASLVNRRALGIDLNQSYLAAYKKASQELGLNEQTVLLGDAIELLKDRKEIEDFLRGEKFSLILIDPPYGDMLAREKTGEAIKKNRDSSPTPFTDLTTDLGNMSIDQFFPIFRESILDAMSYLKPKGHIAIFMKDLQPTKKNPNLLHARVIEDLAAIDGLNYLGMKIWADQGVNLYPYGYPFAFVSNQIHQYIMFFRMD
jgi:DNA modification methylase